MSKGGILSILKKNERSLRLVGVLAPTPRRAIPSFDIRYSAVRCSARLQAAKTASVIIKNPSHFGEVSYEQRLWPKKAVSLNGKETLIMQFHKREWNTCGFFGYFLKSGNACGGT